MPSSRANSRGKNSPKSVDDLFEFCTRLETSFAAQLEALNASVASQLSKAPTLATQETDAANIPQNDAPSTEDVSKLQALLDAQIAAVRASIAKEMEGVRADIARLSALSERHSDQIDAAEQYSRRNCLLVHGIPELPNEDVVQAVIQFALVNLNVTVRHEDLDRCHRLGPPRSTAAQVAASGRPRPIIVKFARYLVREQIWSVKSRLAKKPFLLTESLTRVRANILNAAKEIAGNRNVWTQDGRIVVLCPDKTRLSVTRERDIPHLRTVFA
jgi:hypothetical protein